jgi:hypothetical protein
MCLIDKNGKVTESCALQGYDIILGHEVPLTEKESRAYQAIYEDALTYNKETLAASFADLSVQERRRVQELVRMYQFYDDPLCPYDKATLISAKARLHLEENL